MIEFRTISQCLTNWVLPDLIRRRESGEITQDLPLEIRQFRIIWKQPKSQASGPIVEINDELNLVAKVKLKRKVSKGELLTIADIDPEECFIQTPEIDGVPAAYILCQSLGFSYLVYLNLEPNWIGFDQGELGDVGIRYPVLDLVNAKAIRELVNPTEKFKILANYNWPPGPGYYPNVLIQMHKNPNLIELDSFTEIVANSFSQDYWGQRIDFWKQTDFFPGRITYIEKAIEAYFNKEFATSIYVATPQFEGLIKSYLSNNKIDPPRSFPSCVQLLKELVLSRPAILVAREHLDAIFQYLEKGTFWTNSGTLSDPRSQVNRHGILHGAFFDFENQTLSLKVLILLDALAYLLLQDKMMVGDI